MSVKKADGVNNYNGYLQTLDARTQPQKSLKQMLDEMPADSVSFSGKEDTPKKNRHIGLKVIIGSTIATALTLVGITHCKGAAFKKLFSKDGLKNLFTKDFAKELWETTKSPIASFKEAKSYQKFIKSVNT